MIYCKYHRKFHLSRFCPDCDQNKPMKVLGVLRTPFKWEEKLTRILGRYCTCGHHISLHNLHGGGCVACDCQKMINPNVRGQK